MTADACNCDADPGHAVQVPCPVHDHPDMQKIREERDYFRESAFALRREREDALGRARAAEARAERATANFRGEAAEVGRLQWPTMPENTTLRVMGGAHGWIDVPIVKGDTVITAAKMIASAMAEQERSRR